MKNVTFINAGAGSGKTYKLTETLSEKLAEKDGNGNAVIKPSQVILTTFTELAAAEIREKARQRFLDAGNFDAAAKIDSAKIGTVHSIALDFIKKFWYLLDYGANVQTITERDAEFYMSQSLAKIVSERDENGRLKKEKELDIFRKFRDFYNICDGNSQRPDYHFWEKNLHDIVEKMEYYDVHDVQESINENLKTIKFIYFFNEFPEKKIQEMRDYLSRYYDHIKNYTTDAATKQKPIIKPLLSEGTDIGKFAVLASKMSSPVGGAKRIENLCPGYTQFMVDVNNLTVSKFNLAIMEPFIEAIFNLAKEWRDDYVNYKKHNHIIDFNDMERLFLQLITNEKEVQDHIRENFRLVMVDEFQDSNPIQLKIFNRLSEIIAKADGHSYWVGDPKQAIYGFRGADTELVNSVSKNFKFHNDAVIHPEDGPNNLGSGRLVESWRSRPALVNLANAVFADKFKGEIDPLCITLTPHFKKDQLKTPAIAHWHNPGIGNQQKVKPEAIACKVKELLNSEIPVHSGKLDEGTTAIRPKDVAILCRKNDTIEEVVKALRKFNIPVSESESNIMQRIEVQLVVTLLQFIQSPTNKLVIANLKRLLWGDTTTAVLKDRIEYVTTNISDNEGEFDASKDKWGDDKDEVVRLRNMVEHLKNLSIPEIVSGLIYECNLPALVAKWGDAATRMQNLSTVLNLAKDYDQMCVQMGLGASINGFIYYLDTIEPESERDNQSDTVKVLTYHGAKGLEWPVVILNELHTDNLNSNELIKKQFMKVREIELSNKAPGDDLFAKKYYLHFFPALVTGSSNPPQPMVDKIKEMSLYNQLEQRTRGEETRLLYVGMTRAKDCIITTGIRDDFPARTFPWLKNVGIETPNINHIWGVAKIENTVEEIPTPNDYDIAVPTLDYSIAEKPQIHNTYGERYLAPSKLADFPGFTSHKSWQEHGIEIETKGWGNDYAAIGNCIHDIFAAYKKGQDDFNKQIATNIIGGYGLAEKLVGHIDAIIRSANWLYDTLQSKFPQREGDKIERELPFMMTLPDGRTLRGDMDLLWHYTDADGNKHCVLVDYKSFQGVALNDHTKSHYAQLSAYTTALKESGIDVTHALIFYPVYSKVHELLNSSNRF